MGISTRRERVAAMKQENSDSLAHWFQKTDYDIEFFIREKQERLERQQAELLVLLEILKTRQELSKRLRRRRILWLGLVAMGVWIGLAVVVFKL